MSVLFQPSQPVFGDWAKAREYLRRIRQQANQDLETATPLEAETIQNFVMDETKRLKPTIQSGAIQALKLDIADFKKAEAAHTEARAKARQRWDATRLDAEIKLAQRTIDRATTPKELKEFYETVATEGSEYQKRAAAEILASTSPSNFQNPPDILEANRLVVKARRDLEGLLHDAATEEAAAQESKMAKQLMSARQAAVGIAHEFKDFYDLEKEVARVTVRSQMYPANPPEKLVGWEVRVVDEPSTGIGKLAKAAS